MASPPEIVHAWTPRENVRLFCEKLAGFCDFSLFVHLEDNEELILEVNLGMPFEKLARSRSVDIPINLSHPRNYRAFIASAAGVTMIMDRLERFVPPGGSETHSLAGRRRTALLSAAARSPLSSSNSASRRGPPFFATPAMSIPRTDATFAAFISPLPF